MSRTYLTSIVVYEYIPNKSSSLVKVLGCVVHDCNNCERASAQPVISKYSPKLQRKLFKLVSVMFVIASGVGGVCATDGNCSGRARSVIVLSNQPPGGTHESFSWKCTDAPALDVTPLTIC